MNEGETPEEIRIPRGPYNAYHAQAFGLVVKLAYHFENSDQPRLEIFLKDEEAVAKEWQIYGAVLDDADPRFATVRFGGPGDEKPFRIGASGFRVTFERILGERVLGDKDADPDGFAQDMPVYAFLLTRT